MTQETAMADDIEILAADVAAFMESRKVTAKCEHCGQNNWGTSDELNKAGGMAVFSSSLSNLIPCISFHCKNCGNIRLIARDVVADWKRKQTENANG